MSPGVSLEAQGRAVACALAGDDGEVIDLARVGIRNLRRRQSQAEVHTLRKALLGLGPGQELGPRHPLDWLVGYVCAGSILGTPTRLTPPGSAASTASAPSAAASASTASSTPVAPPVSAAPSTPAVHPPSAPPTRAEVIAVTDHANLTWDSPLTGPNDDSLGPRFPVTAGLYEPAPVVTLLGSAPAAPFPDGLTTVEGVVAGVWDELDLTPFERRVVSGGFLGEGREFAAVSAELTPVAILAAHLGFRVAAAVIASTGQQTGT